MAVLKRIGVLSMAKVQSAILATIAFVIVLLTDIVVIANISYTYTPMFAFGYGMAIIMLVVITILYGVLGCVLGAIGALIYNFVSEKFGGVEIEIDKSQ